MTKIAESSRFNSDERLLFALPLFAGQSRDPRGTRAQTSCGILVTGSRITISRLSTMLLLPCHKRKRERGSLNVSNESRLTCTSLLLLTRKNQFRQVVRVNDKGVNRILLHCSSTIFDGIDNDFMRLLYRLRHI